MNYGVHWLDLQNSMGYKPNIYKNSHLKAPYDIKKEPAVAGCLLFLSLGSTTPSCHNVIVMPSNFCVHHVRLARCLNFSEFTSEVKTSLK